MRKICGLLLGLSLPAYALASSAARDAAWQPLEVLWGGGDKGKAVAEMKRLARAGDAFLHRRTIDAPTQAFIDGVLADLTDFNLGKLQARLPHEAEDGYRELRVRGELRGDRYEIGQPREPFAVTLDGPRSELGAASLVVRSKRLWTINERKAYTFGGSFGLGVGELRWERALEAAERAGRLIGPELVASSDEARERAHRAHPLLAPEDVEVLALAFEAYPALSAFASKFGAVQNVRTVWHDRGYQQINISLRSVPAQFAREYPEVAHYLERFGDLVRARGRWVDARGRTLALGTVDSKQLTATVSCYLKDGRLLPFQGNDVFEDQPLDPRASAQTKLIATAHLKMFGVSIQLREAELDASYVPHPGYAEFRARFHKVPTIEISGAALGFIPTEMVDAFIPGTIAGLTQDFLRTAANAHHGEGASARAELGTRGAHGVLAAEGEGVALDNALIRMAISMVNDRMLPTPALFAELERIADGAHGAFVRDLARYEAAP